MKRIFCITFILCMISTIALGLEYVADPNGNWYLRARFKTKCPGSVINVREGPSLDSKIYCTIEDDRTIVVYEECDGWCLISKESWCILGWGALGWVSAKYVVPYERKR